MSSRDYQNRLLIESDNRYRDLKMGLICLGTGLLVGYNWDKFTSILSTTYNIASTTISHYLTPINNKNHYQDKNIRFIVGVGVIVRDGNKVLMGRRLNSIGDGLFAVPGGHLDATETFFQAGIRELYEETGLIINPDEYNQNMNNNNNNINDFDKNVYIHPASHQLAIEQYCYELRKNNNVISTQDKLIQNNNNNNNQNDSKELKNAFLSPQSIEVYCPDENCQLIVRMVIVDKPFNQIPQLKEGHKCENWYWVDWEDIQKLAQYHQNVSNVKNYQSLPLDVRAIVTNNQIERNDNNNNNTQNMNETTTINKDIQPAPPQYTTTDTNTDNTPTNNDINNDQTTTTHTQTIQSHSTEILQQPLPPINNHSQQTLPLTLPSLPQFSEGCVLKHTDQLFGPLQALVLSGYNPINAYQIPF